MHDRHFSAQWRGIWTKHLCPSFLGPPAFKRSPTNYQNNDLLLTAVSLGLAVLGDADVGHPQDPWTYNAPGGCRRLLRHAGIRNL
ncbi:hypothetical protein LZ31DRAFT_212060 [Colletotrichum somersetense]|nr:hypothetical protein LZ31DRAFT_212060 [Colletotrichum somersetense]